MRIISKNNLIKTTCIYEEEIYREEMGHRLLHADLV